MTKSPYSVLGIPEGAPIEECTAAYKKLAKKYHPDLNPGDKTAEKKMADINAAYDAIKSGSASGGFSGDSQPDNTAYYAAVVRFINNRQFAQAVNLLDEIENKSDVWYYLASVAYFGLGRYNLSRTYIDTACNLSPNNATYRQTRQRIYNAAENSAFDFTGFDGSDFEYDEPVHRHFEVKRGGCLSRFIKIVVIILVIRLVIYCFSVLVTYFRRYNYNNYGSGSSYSRYYGGSSPGSDYFGDSAQQSHDSA